MFSALWVSVSDWTGKGSPLTANFVGVDNYQTLLTKPGLAQRDLGTALRNNMYYVFLVVPLQTVLALVLAIVLNRRRLKGKGFFRSAFYFPSVTSSVAISIVFLFLFNASGVVNAVLAWFGINGPNWFADPRGVGHILLGLVGVDTENPPELLDRSRLPGAHLVAVVVRAVGGHVRHHRAGRLDHRRHLHAAVPGGVAGHPRGRRGGRPDGWHHGLADASGRSPCRDSGPTLFLVVTLGLIGTWQVFDQIYIMSQGGPAKSTRHPRVPVLPNVVPEREMGSGSGNRVHPVRHHRDLQPVPAVRHA